MMAAEGWYSRALEGLSRWRTGMLPAWTSGGWSCAAVYALLSVGFCWPLFAHPFAAGPGDWDQHLLYYAAVLRNAAFGDLPFWNPWYCGGNVLWANPQVSLVSPVYLLALVMPLTLAMKLNIFAHYLAGCFGMHLIVRRIIGVKGTAVTVFLVSLFVFSGAIALHLRAGHTVYLPVLLLPLVVYCFWQASAGEARSVVLGGAVIGFSILNGGTHVAPLAAVLLGVLGLGSLAFGRRVTPLVLAGVMFVLGCAYAAPRIAPAVTFIRSADFHDTRPVKAPDFMSAEMLWTAFFSDSQRTLRGKVTPGVQLYGWQEYGNYLGWFGAALALGSAGWIIAFRRRREHWREPVFPFVTRAFLGLLDGRDVAVSFASAFCSVLAIWFTYLLGAAAWSRPVGLLAALGLSLDHDVLTLASRGWRDDAYVAAVALCVYLMLRCWRVGQAPVRLRRFGPVSLDPLYVEAVVLGVAAGLAVLTRIMAVPFLAAGGACLVFGLRTPWRRRLAMAGIGVATALIVAGPYFVNCWRVHGDPLYTFNVHGGIYSARQGEGEWKGSTAGYVARRIAERPVAAVDTVVQGVTTYPFSNKWHGLDRWVPGLGNWASVAALGGLLVLAACASGRLLLIAVWASLLPFSFTWPSDPDFRFTVHVYPALLIAAAVGAVAVFHGARAVLVSTGLPRKRSEWGRRALAWAAVVGPAVVMLWLVLRVLPPWTFAEALRTGEAAMLTAGVRDRAFVGSGWSEITGTGNVRMRVATTEGTIWLRLPTVADYPVALRMDPFPRPLGATPGRLPVVEVVLNGVPLEAITLGWTPGRVGSYTVTLPRAAVRRGLNRLVLRVRRADPVVAPRIRPGLSGGDAIGLWYVRVQPATADAPLRSPLGRQ